MNGRFWQGTAPRYQNLFATLPTRPARTLMCTHMPRYLRTLAAASLQTPCARGFSLPSWLRLPPALLHSASSTASAYPGPQGSGSGQLQTTPVWEGGCCSVHLLHSVSLLLLHETISPWESSLWDTWPTVGLSCSFQAGPALTSVPGRFGDKDAAAETSGVPSTHPNAPS